MSFASVYLFSPFAELIWLSIITGFCTYLSFPLFYWTAFVRSWWFLFFNAIAIGILVFLLLDIYVDVNEVLFPTLANGTVSLIADPKMAAAFFGSVAISFAAGYATQGEEGEEAAMTGDRTANAVAVGIGLQNLTEGLALGAAWALGNTDLAGVIVLGYSVQNMTEGFPIIAAYMGKAQPSVLRLVWLFFVRGIPTVIGGLVGFEAVNSFIQQPVSVPPVPTYGGSLIDTFINGLAIGAILYCILPILVESFKPQATYDQTTFRLRVIFWGTLAGFLIGFGVGLF